MATDWGPVLQTGIGAVAAALGGFSAAWIQGRSQLQLQRQRRRERAADTLTEVTALAERMNPAWLNMWQRMAPDEAMRPHAEQRREVRGKLVHLAARTPSRRVRRVIHKLDPKLNMLVASTWVYLEERAKGESADKALATVKASYSEVQRLLGKLVAAL